MNSLFGKLSKPAKNGPGSPILSLIRKSATDGEQLLHIGNVSRYAIPQSLSAGDGTFHLFEILCILPIEFGMRDAGECLQRLGAGISRRTHSV